MQKVKEKIVSFIDDDRFYHRFKVRLLKAKRKNNKRTEVTFWVSAPGHNRNHKVFTFNSDVDCFEEMVELLDNDDITIGAASHYIRNLDKSFIKVEPRFENAYTSNK